MPHYNTFIVRIWSNKSDEQHGEITHVASQEKRAFLDLNFVLEFMHEHIRRFEAPAEGRAQSSEK